LSRHTSIDNRRAAQDTEAFIAYLDTRSDFTGGKVGVVGYCMGGGIEWHGDQTQKSA
jgi:carboxymethylenebutenolidase